MNQEELRQALDKLQLELLNLGPQDPETQAKVDALLDRINNPDMMIETEEDEQSLQEQLEDAVTHFESTHPTLSGIIGQVMSLLSSIGI